MTLTSAFNLACQFDPLLDSEWFSVQAKISKHLRKQGFKKNVPTLLLQRIRYFSPEAPPSRGCFAVQVLQRGFRLLPQRVVLSCLRTLVNGWAKVSRFDHRRADCISGCGFGRDHVAHYFSCHLIRGILGEFFIDLLPSWWSPLGFTLSDDWLLLDDKIFMLSMLAIDAVFSAYNGVRCCSENRLRPSLAARLRNISVSHKGCCDLLHTMKISSQVPARSIIADFVLDDLDLAVIYGPDTDTEDPPFITG